MKKAVTKNSHGSPHHQLEGERYKHGAKLALLAIILFAIFEAWGFYVVKTIKPDWIAYQYFRIMLDIPLMFFFYNGHKWALWLVRVGFALGTPAAIFLCVLLIHKNAYLFVVPSAAIPIAVTVAGCWILFGSETYMLHFKHKRHQRSIYD